MKIIVSALILGLSAIIAVIIAGTVLKYRFHSNETIAVTGLAEKNFISDLIVWEGSFSRRSMDLKTAYASLKQDELTIKQFLLTKGVNEKEIIFSSVQINKEFTTKTDANGREISQEFAGYNLTETVRVESTDVNKIEKISREATDIIQSGIEFNSSAPSYYYSKLADIKIDLLGKASNDARQRAETIAKNSGSVLGKLKKANMGVFQIKGKNTNEDYSYGGVFNTSDKIKTGSITIKMEFAVE